MEFELGSFEKKIFGNKINNFMLQSSTAQDTLGMIQKNLIWKLYNTRDYIVGVVCCNRIQAILI